MDDDLPWEAEAQQALSLLRKLFITNISLAVGEDDDERWCWEFWNNDGYRYDCLAPSAAIAVSKLLADLDRCHYW